MNATTAGGMIEDKMTVMTMTADDTPTDSSDNERRLDDLQRLLRYQNGTAAVILWSGHAGQAMSVG